MSSPRPALAERELEPALPALGAVWDGAGVDFRVLSRHATSVELCLFDASGASERERVPLGRDGLALWHARVEGLEPGQLYGYRVRGPWDPARGQRFDARKLLVDPAARAVSGSVRFDPRLLPSPPVNVPAAADSAPFVPRAVVVDPRFDWQGVEPPRIAPSRRIVYEAHVKGLTRLCPALPPEQRGRYLGLAHPFVIEHLRSLGVTTLSLLPVQHAERDLHLLRLGKPNYWGYGTLSFFAPDARYASGERGEQVLELKAAIRALHAAGIEVWLDVVYNHTPESHHEGLTLSLRGLDDALYYRAHPSRPGEYEDFTGCGNTLDVRQPEVRALIHASLRHWVEEYRVDGFRFDLAPALGRDPRAFDAHAPLFEELRRDPVLARTTLIAEPWDLGPDGYQVGGFATPWCEWNGRFRDDVRGFWNQHGTGLGALAACLAGSRALYEPGGRPPQAGIGFVTCHDGFTLADLVRYDVKHNESNGEGNRDGRDDNRSRNWGIEGPSDDPGIEETRERVARCLLATVALAQGTPMLSHGDELGRTQRGNNNAYCHDDELSWTAWPSGTEPAVLAFTRAVLALRAHNAVFRRRRWLVGAVDAEGRKDVVWLHPDGREMSAGDWNEGVASTLGMLLPAAAAEDADEHGAPQEARTALLLVHAGDGPREFALPPVVAGTRWRVALHGACPLADGPVREHVRLAPHSLLVLELERLPASESARAESTREERAR